MQNVLISISISSIDQLSRISVCGAVVVVFSLSLPSTHRGKLRPRSTVLLFYRTPCRLNELIGRDLLHSSTLSPSHRPTNIWEGQLGLLIDFCSIYDLLRRIVLRCGGFPLTSLRYVSIPPPPLSPLFTPLFASFSSFSVMTRCLTLISVVVVPPNTFLPFSPVCVVVLLPRMRVLWLLFNWWNCSKDEVFTSWLHLSLDRPFPLLFLFVLLVRTLALNQFASLLWAYLSFISNRFPLLVRPILSLIP